MESNYTYTYEELHESDTTCVLKILRYLTYSTHYKNRALIVKQIISKALLKPLDEETNEMLIILTIISLYL